VIIINFAFLEVIQSASVQQSSIRL